MHHDFVGSRSFSWPAGAASEAASATPAAPAAEKPAAPKVTHSDHLSKEFCFDSFFQEISYKIFLRLPILFTFQAETTDEDFDLFGEDSEADKAREAEIERIKAEHEARKKAAGKVLCRLHLHPVVAPSFLFFFPWRTLYLIHVSGCCE
jgi:hypothetical protein